MLDKTFMERMGKEQIDQIRHKVSELLESKDFILFFVYPPKEGESVSADVINNLPKEHMKYLIRNFSAFLDQI